VLRYVRGREQNYLARGILRAGNQDREVGKMLRRAVTIAAVTITVAMTAGCGGEEKPSKKQEAIEGAFARVFEGQEKLKAQEEGMDKLKEKAAAEAEEAREDAYGKAIALPAELPPTLDKACAEMSAAYDAFMQSKLADTALARWQATKEVDLAKGVDHCKKTGSIEVAACQAHALRNPPPTATDKSGRDLLLRCEGKFGSGAEKKAATK
jgi:hypothetical protein